MKQPVMKQASFASLEYANKKRQTRREKFLGEMEQVVPWARLIEVIEPRYPVSGRVGRPPIGVEKMLRMYFVQQWYSLSDEGLEDALYDIQALREFVGVDLGRESVPDATTLLRFRHLLEEHQLTQSMFEQINEHLRQQGLLMTKGTLVDATIMEAPSSTKNKDKSRDPEMHQTKKGNEWHFGAKAHIGVDDESGLVHSLQVTAANAADVAHAHEVLHGQEERVGADAGYTGLEKREEVIQAQQEGKLSAQIEWNVAAKRGSIKKMAQGPLKQLKQALERVKAQIRSKVEHPFHIVKNLFGYDKLSYKGVAKNKARLYSLFALANLVIVKKSLLVLQGTGTP